MTEKKEEEDFDFMYKIILVGDSGVGKTSLMTRYIKGSLPKAKGPTIGVEFATKIIPLPSGVTVKAQIWDTAGQEKYRAMTKAHYKRAVGAMIVYDVNERNSFENVKRWITEVRSLTEPDTVLILVGNKIDLCENDPSMRKVPKAEAEKFSNENGVLFVESSAEACNNVRESFEVLLQKIYSNSKENKENGISLVDANLVVNGTQARTCC